MALAGPLAGTTVGALLVAFGGPLAALGLPVGITIPQLVELEWCIGVCFPKGKNGEECDGAGIGCLGGSCYCHTCRNSGQDGSIGKS